MLLLIAALLPVSACTTRPGPEVLDVVKATDPQAKQVTVYVATTRKRQSVSGNVFTSGRATGLNYARFTISVPPGHKPGEIEWPKSGRPDAAKTFSVIGQQELSAADFAKEISRSKKASSGGEPGVGVFVHGYNFNFQESLFRAAQMNADSDVGGTPVLFSWPSQASLAGYLADKESVTYSRDHLAELLVGLTAGRPKGSVLLFGHSMGGWLVTETLRQLKLTGQGDTLAKLNVILAAPDIDVDVFRQQVAVIGPLSPPMTILVSKDDRALMASGLIAGNNPRIGALDIENPDVRAAAEREKILLVDISNISASDTFKHDRYVQLATLYPKLTKDQNASSLAKVGGYILDAAAVTVASPFRLASMAISPQ